MENVTSLLKRDTGLDWCEVSNLYIDYRSKYAPFGQFCVFTPDDYIRKGKFSRFYLPNNGTRLHDPDWFVKHYLNTKKQLVKTMPWIKVDLDQFPKKTVIIPQPIGKFIVGSISFKGVAKIKPINSNSNINLGVSPITLEASYQVAKFLKQSIIEKIDLENGTFSVGIKNVQGNWSSSLTLEGNIIKAEVTPPPLHFMLNGWEFEIELSLILEGGQEQNPAEKNPGNFWEDLEIAGIAIIIAIGISALIVFTGIAGIAGIAA